MRLVATRRLELGMVLARDVTIGPAREHALLRTGVAITERYRQALLDAGFNAVYINDELSSDIAVTPALSERTRATATQSLGKAFRELPASSGTRSGPPASLIAELTQVADLIACEISENGQAVIALSDLAAADAYTLQHSVDVCAVGLMLAKRLFEEHGRVDYRGNRVFDRQEQWLAKLGVGLMLHDIGKMAIPQEILTKPGKLTPEEWHIVRTHPLVGLEMLSSDAISPLIKAVVRSHHERYDGGGYPIGTAGDAIPHFARIAAVADVFDAVTSERPYKPAKSQHVGHEVVNQGSGTQFDPEVVHFFNKVVAPWPPGDGITLADGRQGVVVSCPPNDLGHPLIRVAFDPQGAPIEVEEIDLAERPELLPNREAVLV